MSNRFLVPLVALLSCIFVACGTRADTDSGNVVIYYYGFEIERITGIHEEEIEELGCTYSADSDAIKRALTEIDVSDSSYERRDVRAKIEMHGLSYFVDRAGFARQGGNHFLLNKTQFIASLQPVGSCK